MGWIQPWATGVSAGATGTAGQGLLLPALLTLPSPPWSQFVLLSLNNDDPCVFMQRCNLQRHIFVSQAASMGWDQATGYRGPPGLTVAAVQPGLLLRCQQWPTQLGHPGPGLWLQVEYPGPGFWLQLWHPGPGLSPCSHTRLPGAMGLSSQPVLTGNMLLATVLDLSIARMTTTTKRRNRSSTRSLT